MGPAVQDNASGGDAHAGNHFILPVELAVEGVLGAVDIEGRRQISLPEPIRIHIAHTEAAVEGIDHATGRGVCRNLIQFIGNIGLDLLVCQRAETLTVALCKEKRAVDNVIRYAIAIPQEAVFRQTEEFGFFVAQ